MPTATLTVPPKDQRTRSASAVVVEGDDDAVLLLPCITHAHEHLAPHCVIRNGRQSKYAYFDNRKKVDTCCTDHHAKDLPFPSIEYE